MRFAFTPIIAAVTLHALAGEKLDERNDLTTVHFGGPSSVQNQVDSDTEKKAPLFLLEDVIGQQTYYDFKESIKRDSGITFGLDYNVLYQYANPSDSESNALGGVFRLYGSWEPTGISATHPGSLVFKLEHRHNLGSYITPKQLANEIGYAGLTAVPFSDAGMLLTNLYWMQNFNNNNFSFAVGQVDTTDYVDIYGLVNLWIDFNNLAFTTNPTIPVPDQGLGAAVRWTIKNNYYVVAGFADANGDPEKPFESLASFFDEHEYFKHIGFGWAGSWKQHLVDNIHLTLWQIDERTQTDVPGGWGTAFSFSRELGKWTPFLRAGYNDGGGAILDRSISTGFGYSPNRKDDRLALGLHWGQPNSEIYSTARDDQYTIETFYRLQMLKHLQIAPDVQLLFNPAFNPSEDRVWVFSLRARLAF